MRIALIAMHFAEYSLMLARALAKRHEVLLLLSERNFKSEIGREDLISGVKGLEVICFPHRLSAGVLIANTWRIAQEVRRFAPDVIHCQEELKDYLIGALTRLPKVPFILTVHDPKPHRGSDAKQVLFPGAVSTVISFGAKRMQWLFMVRNLERKRAWKCLG